MSGISVRCWCVFVLLSICAFAYPIHAQPSIVEVLEGKSLNPSEVDPSILDFFERFSKGLVAQDTDSVAALIDTDALCDEIERCMPKSKTQPLDREFFKQQVLPVLAHDLCRPEVGMSWDRIQIKAVNKSDDNAIAVTARHWDHEGIGSKVTWHLLNGDQGMRLYDVNQIDVGVHWSRVMAASMLHVVGGNPEALVAIGLMYDGMLSAAQGDIELAIEQLEAVDSDALPEALRGMVFVVLGGIYMDQGEPTRALTYLDQAASLETPLPIGHFQRAVVLNELGRHGEALVEADRYAKLVGVDADVLAVVGDAYVGTDRFDMAVRAFKKALEDDPQHFESLCKLLMWLPDDGKDAFKQYYQKVERRSEVGKEIAEVLNDIPDPVSLKALLAIHEDLNPQDEWIKKYTTAGQDAEGTSTE